MSKHFNGTKFTKCTAKTRESCPYGTELHIEDNLSLEEENRIVDNYGIAQHIAEEYFEKRVTKTMSGRYLLKNYNVDSNYKDRLTETGFLKYIGIELEGTQVSKAGEFYTIMTLANDELNDEPSETQEELINSRKLFVMKDNKVSPEIEQHLQSYIEATGIKISDDKYLQAKDCKLIMEDKNNLYIWPDDNFSADVIRIRKNKNKEKSFVSSYEVKTLCNSSKAAQGSTKEIYYDGNGIVGDIESGEILSDDYDVLAQGYHDYRVEGYDGVRDLISDYEQRTVRMPGNKNIVFIDKEGKPDIISCSQNSYATKKREELINSGKYIGDLRIHANKNSKNVTAKEVDYFLNSKVDYGRVFKDGKPKTEFTLSDIIQVKGNRKSTSSGVGVWLGETSNGSREYDIIIGNFRKRLSVQEFSDLQKGGTIKITDFRYCPITCSVQIKDVS
jgi:hypothetical protein